MTEPLHYEHRTELRPALHCLTTLMLLAAVGVSLAVTPDRLRTVQAALPLLLGLLLCGATARWPNTRPRLLRVWTCLVVAGAGLCVLGLLGIRQKTRVLWPQLEDMLSALLAARDRLFGRLGDAFHPNIVAGNLVLLTPFALAAASFRREGLAAWRRLPLGVLYGLLWLAGCGVVLLTQSRGAYLGLAAGTLVLVCLCARALWVVLPCAALGAVALGVAGVWPVLGKLAAGAFTVGLGWRATVWANALRVLSSAPFTGVGMGCFRLVTATLFPMAGAGSVDASHAHNLFLQVGIDLGIPGLMAYLASLGLSGYLLVRAYRAAGQRHDGAMRALAAAGVASLVGICVHGLVDVAVWGNKGAFLPWVVMGLSAALYRASEQDAARL